MKRDFSTNNFLKKYKIKAFIATLKKQKGKKDFNIN